MSSGTGGVPAVALSPADIGSQMLPGQVRLRNVTRTYRVMHDRALTLKETVLRRRRVMASEHRALNDVTLDIEPGVALGVVGRNGSGKSTLLKLLTGVIPPTAGEIDIGGSIGALLELGSGFHPEFTGRENVYLSAALTGQTEREVDARIDQIIEFAELEEYIDMPVRTYSSGMQVRLAFAVTAYMRPDILILDEVLAVGDEAFQRKCMARINDYLRHDGTLVFVSHDAGAVEALCDRAVLIEAGEIIEDGPPMDVLGTYRRLLTKSADRTSVVVAELPESDEQTPRAVDALALRGYRLLGPAGVSSRFMSGDPLVVEIDVSTSERLSDLSLRVSLHSDEGVLVHSDRSDLALDPDPAGSTVRFEIPALPLQGGGFSISFEISDALTTEPIIQRDLVLPFSIFPRTSSEGMVVVSGTSVAVVSSTVASVSPELVADAPTAVRRDLTNGFSVGGEAGHVLLCAGHDWSRGGGGGACVFDGRSTAVVDRVSTTAMCLGNGVLWRAFDPGSWAYVGSGEFQQIDAAGIRHHARIPEIRGVGQLVSVGDAVAFASLRKNAVYWIGEDGRIGRIWRPSSGAADSTVHGVIEQGGRALALVSSVRDGRVHTDLVDTNTNEVAAAGLPPADRALDLGGSLGVCSRGSSDFIRIGSHGETLERLPLEGDVSAVAASDEFVFVGTSVRPSDHAPAGAARLRLLDRETWIPLIETVLPIADIRALVLCPRGLIDGLRASADSPPSQLLAGTARPGIGWQIGARVESPSISLRLSEIAPLAPGELCELEYELENHSESDLVGLPPFPVLVAYRWMKKENGPDLPMDTPRTELPGPVSAGGRVRGRVRLEAPPVDGRHRLRLTLVQEGVGWFDEIHANNSCEIDVVVSQGLAESTVDQARVAT